MQYEKSGKLLTAKLVCCPISHFHDRCFFILWIKIWEKAGHQSFAIHGNLMSAK